MRKAAAVLVAAAIAVLATLVHAGSPAAAAPLNAEPRVIADPAVGCPDLLFTPSVLVDIAARAAGRGVTAAVYDTRQRCWHHLAPGLQITTASVIKVEILAGVVLRAQRENRELTAWERDRAQHMIRFSHNPPAGELLTHIGGVAGMRGLDAAFGATATTQSSTFGAVWSTAIDRTRITAGLLWGGGPVDAARRELAAAFMDDVHPTQTWGVTAGVPAGYRVALKNGFYPMRGFGWRVGSTGLVRAADGEGYVITVMTDRNGDQVSGVDLVEAVSRHVAAALLPGPAARRAVDAAVCTTTHPGQGWAEVAAAVSVPAERWSEVRDVSGGDDRPYGGQRACSPDLEARPVESCFRPADGGRGGGEGDGYLLLASTGALHSYGGTVAAGRCAPGTAVAVAVDGSGGWWALTDVGAVVTVGGAILNGPPPPGRTWVAIAAGPPGAHRVAATDGTVAAFGTATHLGDAAPLPLAAPIVAMASSPSGDGYWLAAADGGVFAFGDARFHGSTGGIALDEPVVGMASSPSGDGYWLVAADGGVFAFGDARFHGSTGAIHLDQPVVGMAATAAGYLLVAQDGGVFAFGDATYMGGLGGRAAPYPVTAVARLTPP